MYVVWSQRLYNQGFKNIALFFPERHRFWSQSVKIFCICNISEYYSWWQDAGCQCSFVIWHKISLLSFPFRSHRAASVPSNSQEKNETASWSSFIKKAPGDQLRSAACRVFTFSSGADGRDVHRGLRRSKCLAMAPIPKSKKNAVCSLIFLSFVSLSRGVYGCTLMRIINKFIHGFQKISC